MCGQLHVWLATCVVGYMCGQLHVWLATCVVGYMCGCELLTTYRGVLYERLITLEIIKSGMDRCRTYGNVWESV